MLRSVVALAALVAVAMAACTYENANLVVSAVGELPQISCPISSVSPTVYLAPLYANRPMIRLVSGTNFKVAVFNQTAFDLYNGGQSATCINAQNCTKVETSVYNSTLSWPYPDTFYFVPICPTGSCTFEVYIRFDAPAPVGGPGNPTKAPSSAFVAAPYAVLLSILAFMLLHSL